MEDLDYDRAMRVYLGGDTDSAIQIGDGDRRLEAALGPGWQTTKSRLDDLLQAVCVKTSTGLGPAGALIGEWLSAELPSFSVVCRKKIEAYALYNVLK